MKSFLVGTPVSLPIEFKINGDLAAPDLDSLQVYLYGQDGVALAGWEPRSVPVDGVQTIAAVEINQSDNETAAEGTIEKRTLVCVFTVGGATHQIRETFLLTPFLNFTATTQDVMSYFGLREGELNPDAVSMVEAYLEAAGLLTKTILDTQLAAPATMFRANRLITLLAARRALPSLRLAAQQLAKSDRTQFERFKTLDWLQIDRQLASDLEQATGVSTDVSSSIITKATPTDVITGV